MTTPKFADRTNLLHRHLDRDRHVDFAASLRIKDPLHVIWTEPKEYLPIDEQITKLINAKDINAPKINIENLKKKRRGCPYASMRKSLLWAVMAADDAVEQELERIKKHKNTIKMADDAKEIKNRILDYCKKYSSDDLVPFSPEFTPHFSHHDYSRDSQHFKNLKTAADSFEELYKSASNLVEDRVEKHDNGGSKGKIWEREFARHITLAWNSLTGENIDQKKYKGELIDFVGAAFTSIYDAVKRHYSIDANSKGPYADLLKGKTKAAWGEHVVSACDSFQRQIAHEEAEEEKWDHSRAPMLIQVATATDGSPLYATEAAVRNDARVRSLIDAFINAKDERAATLAALDLMRRGINLQTEGGMKAAESIMRGQFAGLTIVGPAKGSSDEGAP